MTVGGALVYVCKRGRAKDYITRFSPMELQCIGKEI